ncbi:MAG: patatin-like phospholipase family protein, partial [Muribaculaceae bacterium]
MQETAIEPKKYKLGLALSGGGARGFAHVGVLKALEERGIKPDIIAGVSAGSIIGVLYSAGFTPEEILKLFVDIKFSDFAELSVPKDGFFKMDKFKRFLKKTLPVENLEELKIPTLVCATDIEHCRSVIFNQGGIVERVAASCSIPIIFKPIKIDGTNYVDGGVLRNLPAWAIRQQCDTLIGVNCSPFLDDYKYKSSIIDIANRTYNLMSKVNAIHDMKMCDVVIQTRGIANQRIFKISAMLNIADSGYNYATRV